MGHAQGNSQFLHPLIGCCSATINSLKIQFFKTVFEQFSTCQQAYSFSPMPFITENNCKLSSTVNQRNLLKADIAYVPIFIMTNGPYHAILPIQFIQIIFEVVFCFKKFTM